MLLVQPRDILNSTLCLHGQLQGQGRCRPSSPACAECRLGASWNSRPSHTAYFPDQRTEAQSDVRTSGWVAEDIAHLTAINPQITTRRVTYATGNSPRGVVKGTSTPKGDRGGSVRASFLRGCPVEPSNAGSVLSLGLFLFGVGQSSPS